MAEATPNAPADPVPDERKTQASPTQQLAAFDGDSAKSPDPDAPEDDNEPTAAAEKPTSVPESRAAEQPSPAFRYDSAATPISRPASDPNATTSAQDKISVSPRAATPASPKSQVSTPPRNFQTIAQYEQPLQATAPINAATMAVGALTGGFRRPEPAGRPAAAAAAAPSGPRDSAPQSLLNRFAIKNILETLRGPQDQTPATPKTGPAATAPAAPSPASPGATTSTRAPATSAPAPGGIRDKLTTFTAERMQPRRDAERVRGVTQAATGVIASLQALEQQETAGILTKIQDAAKSNGGIENVLSEMRPGGQFEDLRKEFNTVLSHDQGFAAAYDKATGAIADYAETRAALPPPSLTTQPTQTSPACKPSITRSPTPQKLFQASRMGQSAFNDLLQKRGREAVEKLFSAVQQTFSRERRCARTLSPSPGFGR